LLLGIVLAGCNPGGGTSSPTTDNPGGAEKAQVVLEVKGMV
jgi:hypothetical protein